MELPKITRKRRAFLRRGAQEIRRRGHELSWSPARIAAAITEELPELYPLEAWRFAHGWSRPEVIAGISALYRRARLAPPALNSSMLCRWEHGDGMPGPEYAEALCRLYRSRPDHLGIAPAPLFGAASGAMSGAVPRQRRPGPDDSGWADAAAVRESVRLALEAEGPTGGWVTFDQLEQAVRYFDLNYSRFPPTTLAAEVRHCRAVISGMLILDGAHPVRDDLLRLAGRLSALLGNLAFHTGDHAAAGIHLGVAAKLAETTGDAGLLSWALAARSMLVRQQGRPRRALELAEAAVHHADTPLRQAQAIAWAQLPCHVALGRADAVRDATRTARRAMDESTEQDQAGRFGFDRPEFELHLAGAAMALGDYAAASRHAEASLRPLTPNRPAWVAATLALAGCDATLDHPAAAAERCLLVLDTVPAEMLRATAWRRLTGLDHRLTTLRANEATAADLHDRLHAIRPATVPVPTAW